MTRPTGSNKRDMEQRLFLKIGFPVILSTDPENPGVIRAYTTASGPSCRDLYIAMQEIVPICIEVTYTDPSCLLRGFNAKRREARELADEFRKWRRIAYVAPLFGAVIAVLAQIIWAVTP